MPLTSYVETVVTSLAAGSLAAVGWLVKAVVRHDKDISVIQSDMARIEKKFDDHREQVTNTLSRIEQGQTSQAEFCRLVVSKAAGNGGHTYVRD